MGRVLSISLVFHAFEENNHSRDTDSLCFACENGASCSSARLRPAPHGDGSKLGAPTPNTAFYSKSAKLSWCQTHSHKYTLGGAVQCDPSNGPEFPSEWPRQTHGCPPHPIGPGEMPSPGAVKT